MKNHKAASVRWMKMNPQALATIEEEANKLLRRRYKFSIQFLVERIRWVHDIELKSTDPFKLSNSYTAYIARHLLYKFPGMDNYLTATLTKPERLAGETKPIPLNVARASKTLGAREVTS